MRGKREGKSAGPFVHGHSHSRSSHVSLHRVPAASQSCILDLPICIIKGCELRLVSSLIMLEHTGAGWTGSALKFGERASGSTQRSEEEGQL